MLNVLTEHLFVDESEQTKMILIFYVRYTSHYKSVNYAHLKTDGKNTCL